jgi:hypothetical protein
MAWYRCPCGYITEIESHAGEVVSAYHIHPKASFDRSGVARMEPLPEAIPEPAQEPVLAGAGPRSR